MIACILTQWKISRRLDDRHDIAPGIRRHLDRCPACRAFAEAATEASARLRAGAPAAEPQSDDRRAVAILSAVRRHDAAPPESETALPLPVLRWAAATALAIALAVAAVYTHRAWGPRVASPFDQLEPVAAAVAAGGARLNDSVEQMVAFSYEAEKARLGADAEAAASFLLACLSL